MKKLLFIALLLWGCEDSQVTSGEQTSPEPDYILMKWISYIGTNGNIDGWCFTTKDDCPVNYGRAYADDANSCDEIRYFIDSMELYCMNDGANNLKKHL